MSTDHHFPRFHIRPATGYVNDPNGPIRHGDLWHLYFQYVQDTPREGPVHWGHATSPDLVEWTVQPDALDAAPGDPDAGGCWSGNTVAADGVIHAFYSVFEPENPFQPVFRATSTDDGATFADQQLVVAGPAPEEHAAQFRDPYVWRHFGRWCMLAGVELPGDVGLARLYESDDLRSWREVGTFAESGGSEVEGAMWECPQYATFGDEGVLLIAAYHPRGGDRHVIAVRGKESAGKLVEPSVSLLETGAFYAPSILRGTDRNLLWGWVTEERSRDWEIEADWSGCLTLPRELRLGDDGVRSFPAAELVGLRDGVLGTIDGSGRELDGLPAQFEIEATLQGSAGTSTVSIIASAEETIDLVVDWDTGRVGLDRTSASRDPRAAGGRSEFVEPQIRSEHRLDLRWFVDGSVGELFSATGQVLTHRFYPTQAPPWRLSLGHTAQPGSATAELTVHRMRDAVHR
ncbi:MAG TPA: glycoside hydrolase family 32 protein [Mycobacteriales bacterium]|nr:glycoside hydrolase family 32 protein [Mycobacteriales bacterium]